MNRNRSTPIDLLPGEREECVVVQQSPPPQSRSESACKLADESAIKMEIKKKEKEDDMSLKIELDMETLLLIGVLFLASYLKTTNLAFLPESLKSDLVVFSIVKTIGLFFLFVFLKKYIQTQ